MIRDFAEQLMAAEAQGLCNAGYGEVSSERVNLRNGYRPRDIDTRVGTIEVAIPKLRRGSYFPEWLLDEIASAAGSRGSTTSASTESSTTSPRARLKTLLPSARLGRRSLRNHRTSSGKSRPKSDRRTVTRFGEAPPERWILNPPGHPSFVEKGP